MTSNINDKISTGAISYFLNLDAQNDKEYNINYNLQVQKIYICKPSIHSSNEKIFYSCTLCDNEYKYSGFIIGRNLIDREPSPGDIIQITRIGVCLLSKKSKKVILIKKYECIYQKTQLIKNVKLADNLINLPKPINLNNNNSKNISIDNNNSNENNLEIVDEKEKVINSFPSFENSQNSQIVIHEIKNTEQLTKSPQKDPKINIKNIFNLSEISTYSKNITIYVKIIKKCEIKTFMNRLTHKESKVLSFDIMDSKGFEMQANIYDNGLEKFNNILQVGEIYYIIGGYAKLADKKYTNIKSDYKLIFDANTQIFHIDKKDDKLFMEQGTEINGIVRFIDLIKYPKNSIIDCLAYVLETSSTTIKPSKNGNTIAIKKILLGDSSGIKCPMTLWKKFTEIPIEKGNILLLKYIRVGEYNGICLTTIDDSNIIINPTEKFKELDNLKAIINSGVDENYFKFLKKEDHINQEIINKQQNQNPILENEKLDYISDLLNNLKDGSNYSANFNIKATVFEIYHSIKNYYCGCPNKSCRKKLSKNSEGEWFCQACREKYIEPYYYYTVSLRIKDLTGEHFVDLFGDSVTTLFGIKAEDYSKLVENNDIDQLNKINDKVEFQNYYFSGKASIQKYNNRIKKQLFVYRFNKEDSEKESLEILNKLKKLLY
jgi:ssDNA-binding replication factor A large subunit